MLQDTASAFQPSQHSAVGRGSVLSHAVRQQHDRSWTQAPPIFCSQVHGLEWLSCYAGHHEVNRCYTRGESEDSVAHR